MRMCDRCRKTSDKINIHQVVIWQEKRDLCTNYEKELEKIFNNFIKEKNGQKTNPT